jgi:vacuolar-type H+-ATPase subunit H
LEGPYLGRPAIDIQHLIDRLEEMVGEARRLPLGGSVVMDRRRLLDLIDQMRVAVPAEVREARSLVQQQEEILAQARQEAERVLSEAQMQVEDRLEDDQIVKAAEERGRELVRQAEEKVSAMVREAEEQVRARLAQAETMANQQMDEADRYALEMLRKLEAQLGTFMTTVRSGIEALEARPGEPERPKEPEDSGQTEQP